MPQKYYIGLDVGTNSVGYAVTDEKYNLLKFKNEPMWGTQAPARRATRQTHRQATSAQTATTGLVDAGDFCRGNCQNRRKIFYPFA